MYGDRFICRIDLFDEFLYSGYQKRRSVLFFDRGEILYGAAVDLL